MKTNAQQIEAIATLVKPFDAIQTAHFLAREIVGYNKSSDRLVELQKEIDDTKIEKGKRKKAIDGLLKELWQNNVKMGKSKCPIRAALREVLSKENLATGTINNILTAVSFALEHKKPYDIKAPDKYNAALKAEKEKEKLKSEILKGGSELKNAIPPTTPPATTPPATTPPKINAPKIEPESATQYIKSLATLMDSAFAISEPRRMLGDEHEKTYGDIIACINDIMDLTSSLK